MSMGKQLLSQYIRLMVEEAHLARVPNQLVSDDGHEGEEQPEEGVNEFAACGGGNALAAGGIQGFSAPFGPLKKKKNKLKRK